MGLPWRVMFFSALLVQCSIFFIWWIAFAAVYAQIDSNFTQLRGTHNSARVKEIYGICWKFVPPIIVWNFAAWALCGYYFSFWLFVNFLLSTPILVTAFLPFRYIPELRTCQNAGGNALLVAYGQHIWPHANTPALEACHNLRTHIWTGTPAFIFNEVTLILGVISLCLDPMAPSTPEDVAASQEIWRKLMPLCLFQAVRPVAAPFRFLWRCGGRLVPPMISYAWRLPKRLTSTIHSLSSPLFIAIKPEFVIDFGPATAWTPENTPTILEMAYRYDGAPKQYTPFEKLIEVDDLFFSLCEHIHASDLLVLGAVNKRTRSVVQQHWNQSRAFLKRHLCYGSQKHCIYCHLRVCNDCKPLSYRNFGKTRKEIQQYTLHSVCSWCYFLNLCGWRHVYRSRYAKCQAAHQQLLLRDGGSEYPCRTCAWKVKSQVDAERIRTRSRRQDSTATTIDATDCCICHNKIWVMPMRWWRCSSCENEGIPDRRR